MYSIQRQYKIDCRVTIELLDTETEDNEKNIQNSKTWNNYVDRITNPLTTSDVLQLNQASASTVRATTNTTGEMSLSIKEEKMDEDTVSK